MSHQKTTDRHRDRAEYERPGSDAEYEVRSRQALRSEVKEQVHHAQTEERDMGEAVQPTFQTAVAAKPVLAMEEESEDCPGNKAHQDAEPGGDQIQL